MVKFFKQYVLVLLLQQFWGRWCWLQRGGGGAGARAAAAQKRLVGGGGGEHAKRASGTLRRGGRWRREVGVWVQNPLGVQHHWQRAWPLGRHPHAPENWDA